MRRIVRNYVKLFVHESTQMKIETLSFRQIHHMKPFAINYLVKGCVQRSFSLQSNFKFVCESHFKSAINYLNYAKKPKPFHLYKEVQNISPLKIIINACITVFVFLLYLLLGLENSPFIQ